MSGISGIAGTTQMLVQSPVKASEGSALEEARESPAEKAREQKSPAQAAARPGPSAPGVGGSINVMA
jgi:hypothetical protein